MLITVVDNNLVDVITGKIILEDVSEIIEVEEL